MHFYFGYFQVLGDQVKGTFVFVKPYMVFAMQ